MNADLFVRIAQIQANIPNHVKLIAVSKQVPATAIRAAYTAGIRDFGENRVQEAIAKQAELADLEDITWHLIGNLQANKAKKALTHFQWIHSVDNLKLAQKLDSLAGELNLCPSICLQVKILPDPNKFGWHLDQLYADLPHLDRCKNLQIQGLMTIPPLGLDEAQTQDVFNRTRELAQAIASQSWERIKMTELSMGMSGDYQAAIQAGATMVRIGTSIFGRRNKG
ncbi:YggS family pyridoxal phosphate-dependent enzyme [Calothrix sp. NIES-3974]|uniref:YggS family pyridoxal phosphate-dependent enzyme n=1 Tax=Calothrix sp. NIES-3974 TaxID=2005462 RepID=UPI003FA49687